MVGRLEGASVAFLPRHGRGHRIMPTEIPARANIYALKTLGVEQVVSISAVGSLKEEIKPLDLVVPDQIIDRTRERPATFFGDGLVAHVGFADPFCPTLRRIAVESAAGLTDAHDGGIYVAMEGPQFSTRAESEMHRGWDASVIGMTALPEAKLAREAEMVLRDARVRYGLRRLARIGGRRFGGTGHTEPDAKRERRAGDGA